MSSLPVNAPAVEASPEPGWNPVHPALLHKRQAVEVFLTHHLDAGDEQRFWLRIPRAHSMNSAAELPVILGLEAVRQVGLALSQLHGNMPADWAVILQAASFDWVDQPPSWGSRDSIELEARCRIDEARLRGEVMAFVAARMVLLQNNRVVATGTGRIRTLPRRAYQALRRHATTTSDNARALGRSVLSRLALDGTGLTAVLGWTYPDPFFFDHDVDHVPGILFAQAALDAHTVLSGAPSQVIALECHRFAELDAPVSITASSHETTCVTVFSQHGVEIARGRTSATDGRWRP